MRRSSSGNPMDGTRMTRLDKPLRRELLIDDVAYTLTIDPEHGDRGANDPHRRGWPDPSRVTVGVHEVPRACDGLGRAQKGDGRHAKSPTCPPVCQKRIVPGTPRSLRGARSRAMRPAIAFAV